MQWVCIVVVNLKAILSFFVNFDNNWGNMTRGLQGNADTSMIIAESINKFRMIKS